MSLRFKVHSFFILILLVRLALPLVVSQSTEFHKYTPYQRLFSVQEPIRKVARRLSKPLIGDDGRVYICLERNLLAFERNGSITWTLPLNYTCNAAIAPVHGGARKMYLVAENRVLKINTMNIGTSESAGEVFFGPEPGAEGLDEIIGLSVSTSSSCVLINIKNRGLFAYKLHGKLLWSAGPVLYQSGYRQGCRKNVTDCYFTSVPVIDQCEASIYISNTEELYALSVRSLHFKWIQDFSSLDKIFTITPGNNGRLYLTVPARALVLALAVSSGTVLWQRSIGPLSTTECAPVVDSNGWISIGSLDGFLYSYSPTGVLKKFPKAGPFSSLFSERDLQYFVLDERILLAFVTVSNAGNPLPCRSTRQKLASSCSQASPKHVSIYTGNERAILLFLLFESAILIILAVLVRFCCMFWRKKKLRGRDLGKFLEKRHSLLLQKKAFDRTITDLEQKAADEAVANEVLEKMVDLVRDREGIERKLSTTYSLGRDGAGSQSKSLLPVYDGKTKSYSFQGAKKESVTIFHTLSDTSSGDNSSEKFAGKNFYEYKESAVKAKTKAPIEVVSSSDDEIYEDDYQVSPSSGSASGSKGFINPLFMKNAFSEPQEVKKCDEGEVMEAVQNGSKSIRRRTLSSTN